MAGNPWRQNITQQLGGPQPHLETSSTHMFGDWAGVTQGKVCWLEHLHSGFSCNLGLPHSVTASGSQTAYVTVSWLVFYVPVWEATHRFCPIWLVETVIAQADWRGKDIDDPHLSGEMSRVWGPCVELSTENLIYPHCVTSFIFPGFEPMKGKCLFSLSHLNHASWVRSYTAVTACSVAQSCPDSL